MTALDLSADLGLAAVWVLTANIVLGLLLGIRYNPWTRWPHRRINYYKVHDWTGYLALCLVLLHPIAVLFSSTAGFRLIDIIYPVHSPKQPLENTIGAVALYALVVVVVTSYFRRRMDRRTWKAIHFLTYLAAAAFFVHGMLTDPKLENRPVDWFDAEKVAVWAPALLVLAGSVLRVRYALRRRGRTARVSAPVGPTRVEGAEA